MSYFQSQFEGGAIPVLQKAMAFHEARHTLLARNIANASTPGYRPTDLNEGDFQNLLLQAVRNRDAGHLRSFQLPESEAFGTDAQGHLLVKADPTPTREGQVRHDGNSFNPEREMSFLADNALAHERATQLLAGSFRTLELAIRGRA